MANPFGGSDEALTVNAGHANAANLIYAFIPRTAAKWREVVNGTDIDVSGAAGESYDAATGYWIPGTNTVFNAVTAAIAARNIDQPWTIILGCKRTAAADAGTASANLNIGLYRNATGPTTEPVLNIRLNSVFHAIAGQMVDAAGGTAFNVERYPVSVTGPYGVMLKGDGTYQSGFVRVGGVKTHTFPTTDPDTNAVALLNTSLSDLDRIQINTANDWPFLYFLVYDSALSNAHGEAIIDSPGDVISIAVAGSNIIRGVKGMSGGMQNLSGGMQ
jgi:hypothetical protein